MENQSTLSAWAFPIFVTALVALFGLSVGVLMPRVLEVLAAIGGWGGTCDPGLAVFVFEGLYLTAAGFALTPLWMHYGEKNGR